MFSLGIKYPMLTVLFQYDTTNLHIKKLRKVSTNNTVRLNSSAYRSLPLVNKYAITINRSTRDRNLHYLQGRINH